MSWKGTLRSISAAQRRAEREALKRQRELERQQKQTEKMQELERAAYEVETFENYIDVLVSTHKDCSESWNWETIKTSNPPEKPIKSNSNELLARQKLDSYKPSLKDKMLKRVETKRSELAVEVEKSKRRDEREYKETIEEYERLYTEWESIRETAAKILLGEVDAYEEAIRQVEPLSEISHLGSSIEFNVISSDIVEADLHVNSEDVIPKESKTLLKSGKLSVKQMNKTKYYELYQDYVCGGVLRVARELFALLPIKMTVITALGELLNTKTGYLEEQSILSVAIPRETLNRLNFDLLDPSDSMENFLHRMKFYKTKGFQPIERILASDLDYT